MNDLKLLIGKNEQIYFEGKPNKKCYILEGIFNPLLPFALIWAIIDFIIFGISFEQFKDQKGIIFLIVFFAIHLMPVWIYLSGVLFISRKYKNTNYIVTDRGIYVSSGLFTKNMDCKPFAELSHINLHRGIFDQMCNAGDIIATTDQLNSKGKAKTITIANITNYIEIYNLVKQLQTDIYSDIMYPNAKRPAENPGYNTSYKKE